MAELIDKSKILYDEVTDERGRTYEVAYVEQIERLPTATEAEIRNKAIDELLSRTEKTTDVFIGINGYLTGADFREILLETAEQLKEK